MWYTCPQLPKCLHKYDKSGYVANEPLQLEEIDHDIENEEPLVAPGNVITLQPRTNDEPPGKRFRLDARRRYQNSATDDDESYCADDENVLDNIDWQQESESDDWERHSEFSDTESSSGSDYML